MSTPLYLLNTASDYSSGTNATKLDGSSSGWDPKKLGTSRGTSYVGMSTSTVGGPTSGVEVVGSTSLPIEWYSDPIAADVTVSGTISFNIHALESSMSANTAINMVVDKVDGATGAVTQVLKTTRTTELGTSASAAAFTGTPTSTDFKRGDRIRVRIFGDDSSTMNSGYSFTAYYNSNTALAIGDTWLSFTETITFSGSASGSTIYLTDTASDVATSAVDREAWTSRGSSDQTDVTNSVTGWTAPIQVTDTAGGTVVDWWTKPLEAFTLGGTAVGGIRGLASAVCNAAWRVEIAVTDNDGTNPVTWGVATANTTITAGDSLTTILISGDDVSVTNGQRLRIRVMVDDYSHSAIQSGETLTLKYNGSSAGAYDSYVILPQTVTEYSAGPASITLGLLDAGNALYAPTVIPDQFLTVPLLDASNALYQPTVTTKNTLTVPLLDSGSALYAPTVLPQPVTVTLGLLDGAPALYAPTLTLAPYPIAIGLLDAASELYAPTITLAPYPITLGLLDAGNALYAPMLQSLGGTQDITLDALDAGNALYAPTLTLAPYPITLGLLDAGNALYAPTMTLAPYPVSLGLLDAGNALYAPTLLNVNTVTLGLLDGAPALYAPTLTLAPYPITLGLLDAGNALYAPTVIKTSGPQDITLGLLDGAPALYAPTITAENDITLGLLDGSPALYAPTITAENDITLGLLDGAPALYAPTVTLAPYPITLGLLDAGNALYAPVLLNLNSLTLGLLDSSPALYAPTITSSNEITLGLLDAANALYAPTIVIASGTQSITLGLIDAGRDLYAPTLWGTAQVDDQMTHGVGPKRMRGQTPFDDWTLEMDDEMVLELYALGKTR